VLPFTDTHERWDSRVQLIYLLATRGFQATGGFQRYPDVLVEPGSTYQQFNDYI
jgi:hypothetical protein